MMAETPPGVKSHIQETLCDTVIKIKKWSRVWSGIEEKTTSEFKIYSIFIHIVRLLLQIQTVLCTSGMTTTTTTMQW